MKSYFNVKLEFDRDRVIHVIDEAIVKDLKGYVCVVDGNVLANVNKLEVYKDIVNSSLVNCCDGSSIAFLASLIHGGKRQTFTGPELFSYFISKSFKQTILGNTPDIHLRLESRLLEMGVDISLFSFIELPFLPLEEFDFLEIACRLNSIKSEIIWVSLGAPKQEVFNYRILPYLTSGVLVGIGAGPNLYLDELNNKRSSKFFRRLKLEWLLRSIKEPKRIGFRAMRYLYMIPCLFLREIWRVGRL